MIFEPDRTPVPAPFRCEGVRSILYCLLAFLLCAPVPLSSQSDESGGLSDLFQAGDDYFLQVVALPSATENRTRTLVLFGLTYAQLSFRSENDRSYIATGGIYVEGVDMEGVIQGYGRYTDTVRTDTFRSTLSRRIVLPGTVDLSIPPGPTVFPFAVETGSSGRDFSSRTDTTMIPDFGAGDVTFGTPILLDRIDAAESGPIDRSVRLVATNADGNLPFGRPFRSLVTTASAGEPTTLDWDLHEISDRGEILSIATSGTGRMIGTPGTVVDAIRPEGSELGIELAESPERSGLAVWAIGSERIDLAIGRYGLVTRLTTTSGTAADTTLFEVRWIDRPLSLIDPSYAISALRPIATDEELSELRSAGDDEEKRRALDAWWSDQDPTPGTLFNERMATYYERVDYAYFNFATIGRQDGAASDRGKIYILYGPPTDVDRRLDPEGPPQEVWTYRNRVGRRFVFTDREESGAYRLIEYYDL